MSEKVKPVERAPSWLHPRHDREIPPQPPIEQPRRKRPKCRDSLDHDRSKTRNVRRLSRWRHHRRRRPFHESHDDNIWTTRVWQGREVSENRGGCKGPLEMPWIRS